MELEIIGARGGRQKVTFTGNPYENDWVNQAACDQTASDELFVSGAAQNKIVNNICRATSQECPVQAACLREAVSTGSEWGVWGGLTERRRRQLTNNAGGYPKLLALIDQNFEAARAQSKLSVTLIQNSTQSCLSH